MAAGIDLSKPHTGLKGTAEVTVGEEHTAPQVGNALIHVLVTPVMINLIETAALAAVEQLLPAAHQSLGTHLDVRHIAATPVGMKVVATAELVKIEGCSLSNSTDMSEYLLLARSRMSILEITYPESAVGALRAG